MECFLRYLSSLCAPPSTCCHPALILSPTHPGPFKLHLTAICDAVIAGDPFTGTTKVVLLRSSACHVWISVARSDPDKLLRTGMPASYCYWRIVFPIHLDLGFGISATYESGSNNIYAVAG